MLTGPFYVAGLAFIVTLAESMLNLKHLLMYIF